MGEQAVLKVDAGQGGGQLAQIAGRRADEARHLAEGPMGGGDGRLSPGYGQGQAFGVIATGFDGMWRVSTVRAVARSARVRTAS